MEIDLGKLFGKKKNGKGTIYNIYQYTFGELCEALELDGRIVSIQFDKDSNKLEIKVKVE